MIYADSPLARNTCRLASSSSAPKRCHGVSAALNRRPKSAPTSRCGCRKRGNSYQQHCNTACGLNGSNAQTFGNQTYITKARDKATESYTRYVNAIRTGHEFDSLIKYDSTEVLKSVVYRLESLCATGIFKGASAPFNPDASVWTYRLNALRPEEKKVFVLFRLQEIFLNAIQRGEQQTLRDVVVLDEAHLCLDSDEANILNTLAPGGAQVRCGHPSRPTRMPIRPMAS